MRPDPPTSLDETVHTGASDDPPPPRSRPLPAAHAEARVGPYHLLRVLGEGGFGVVYLAQRREPFVQAVALKVLKPGMDSSAVLARFELERQALAMMDHPGIAKVLDGGLTEPDSRLGPGRPYFVMELVRGEPITDYCRDNRLTIGQRLDLFLAVCDAVQHAHTKGVIHRDLKPGNILVSEANGRPVPKVIDFGVAKAVESLRPEQTMTMTGQFIGTPEYMSPEQAAGSSEGAADIDTRSDVYALGVVLYRLLTGTLPFDAEQLRRAGLLETLRVIREVEPPRPSTRVESRARTIRPDSDAATAPGDAALILRAAAAAPEPDAALARRLRGDLDWICMRALEKPRERRYQSPGALAADIRRYLRDEPVEAGPPTLRYRAAKFARRHKAPVAAGALALGAVVAGLVLALYGLGQARTQRDHAVAAESVAEQRRRQAEVNLEAENRARRNADAALRIVFKGMVASSPLDATGSDYTVADLLRALEHAARTETSAPARVQILRVLGSLHRFRGELKPAEQLLQEALDGARALPEPAPMLEAEAAVELARVCNDRNDPTRAKSLITGILPALRASRDPESPRQLTRALTALGLAELRLGDRARAAALLREAAHAADTLLASEPAEAVNPLTKLAEVLADDPATRDEALRTAQQAVEACDRATEVENNDLLAASARNTLARARRAGGDLRGAAQAYEEALRLLTAVEGAPALTIAATQHNLAMILRDLGDTTRADPLVRKAVATRRELAPNSPDLVRSLDLAGLLALDRSDLDAAEAAFKEELDLASEMDTGAAAEAARAQTGLADVALRREDFDRARRLAEKALATRKKVLPAGAWPTANTQTLLAAALAGLGQFETAENLMLEALTTLRADPGARAALPRACLRAAFLYQRWNKPEQAAKWTAEAKGSTTDQPPNR